MKHIILNKMRPYRILCMAILLMLCVVIVGAYAKLPVTATSQQTESEEVQLAPQPLEPANMLVLEVKKGDTFSDILQDSGISPKQTFDVISELQNIYDMSSLSIGQKIKIFFDINDAQGKKIDLRSMYFDVPGGKRVEVRHLENEVYLAHMLDRFFEKKLVKARGTIESALFTAARKENVSAEIIDKLIRIYSYDVDFQRDIRKGNQFEVLYEVFINEDGIVESYGKILYSSLTLNTKDLTIYSYTKVDGKTDYYDANGVSVRKSLLKTPIDGARITSRYGKRRHPVLGYTKVHKGVDFGAPRGTPVYAAGNGKVVKAQRYGSYGNYVKIRHQNGHSTAYAHLSKYGKNIRAGKSVEQGQIIGYVGTTGRSTGPHLHYEVLLGGKHINPMSVKTFPGKALKGLSLAVFEQYKQQVYDVMLESKLAKLYH